MEKSGSSEVTIKNLEKLYHEKGITQKHKNELLLACADDLLRMHVSDEIPIRGISKKVGVHMGEVYACIVLYKHFSYDIEAIKVYMSEVDGGNMGLHSYMKKINGYKKRSRTPNYEDYKSDFEIAKAAIEKLRAEAFLHGENSDAGRHVAYLQDILNATIPIIEPRRDDDFEKFLKVCDCARCGNPPIFDKPNEIYEIRNHGTVVHYPLCEECASSGQLTPNWNHVARMYRILAGKYYGTLMLTRTLLSNEELIILS